jgi:predicted ester cyclase
MNRNQIEAFTERWLNAVCTGDTVAFEHLTAVQALDTLNQQPVTRLAFQERARAVFDAFEGLHGRVIELVLDGDRIAWRWTLTGQQRAPFLGEPNSGRQITLQGINLQRLQGGLVSEHFTLLDVPGALRQLRRGSSIA